MVGVSYSFVTVWRVPAPLPQVWEAIYHSERWPAWWKGLEQVVELRPAAGASGLGSLRRYTWKGRLPYRLTVDLLVTRVTPMALIESQARGELEGKGVWRFLRQGEGTVVQYDWNVRTTKAWMNWAAVLARPLFRWNHNWVMRQGEVGLARLLEHPQE